MNPLLKKITQARKFRTKLIALALAGVLTLGMLAGCGQTQSVTETAAGSQVVETAVDGTVLAAQDTAAAVLAAQGFEFDEEDFLTTWEAASATKVALNGTSITVEGLGAAAEGNTLKITAPGTYVLSGTLDQGQVIVNVGSDEAVRLVLNGVTITNQGAPAILIEEADRAYMTLAEGSINTLTMAASTAAEAQGASDTAVEETEDSDDAADSVPDGVIYSKGDLTLNGSGSLTVNGSAKHGIVGRDDLRITGGVFDITAASDAVRGKDLIAIHSGEFKIVAGADAFQSSSVEEADKGFIVIEGGCFQIKAGADGLQAETALVIEDGDFDIESGGGSVNAVQKASQDGKSWNGDRPADGTRPQRGTPPTGVAPVSPEGASEEPTVNSSETVADTEDTSSTKGLKAGAAVVITGGTFAVDSADDGLHSNGSIEIQAGTFEIESGDDGIHADVSVLILGGDVEVRKSYEGLEAAQVTIRGGDVSLVSSDDGINTSGEKGLSLEGGFVTVNAEGDGIDLNGSGSMSGGTLLVHGPTNSGNGAMDYNGDFVQSGGLLIASGSSGMAQGPSASSTELSALIFLTNQTAGTLVRVEAEDGTVIAVFRPAKAFSSLVIASPEFVSGETYHAYVGGSSTGEEADGLVTGGEVTGGTEAVSFEISGSVTQAVQEGASAGGMGGGMKRPGN
ncbi:MAG: carbohydrate-binding domain-containing protein [Acidaminobacter sp.]|uniref:carbohydrate-binding domain-containing protein n=1 Tax=Acidaminobacter sp. TaxID=1872102 RepID=UPI0013835AA6|nr:carbohydrate-binding domain-containing protein [Acidaminobacter sp.]MZQ97131.1 carbohydrate-binding domain-containing protein [Acidaminobacter sp.]